MVVFSLLVKIFGDSSTIHFPPVLKKKPLCLDSVIVSALRLCWVKGVCVFRCNLPPALLAEWLGSFTCHCSNTGSERTLNKSQHRKLTLEKKILPWLLPGFKLATFESQVQRSYQPSILAVIGTDESNHCMKRQLSACHLPLCCVTVCSCVCYGGCSFFVCHCHQFVGWYSSSAFPPVVGRVISVLLLWRRT